ncbi:MAG: anthranilate synthase component I [Deltaproteobacteria bacterium]|nr:MAG: anthranilate synthase component I [Deltaproteobacteria bacterium]
MFTIYPSLEEFLRLAEKHSVVPVYGEVIADCETPVSAYLKLRKKEGSPSFLLESVEGGEKWGRYSFLGFSPLALVMAQGRKVVFSSDGERREEVVDDPLLAVKGLMGRYSYPLPPGFPRLACGAVGYVGYDYVRFIERLPDDTRKSHSYPDLFFMVPSLVVVFDNLRKKTIVIANVPVAEGKGSEERYREARERVRETVDLLFSDETPLPPLVPVEGEGVELTPGIPPGEMARAIEKTKEYIVQGEAIQVVLSNRFTGSFAGDPFSPYRALRVINPSPYMFYIETGDVTIAGSSPEVLVRLEGDTVILRPIAGTRPRGRTEEEDRELEEDLLSDPKEISEHLMLVDLGRNDLGRISRPGSVSVSEFMVIERYSHVMHIVSNVVSKLGEGKDAFDVLRATFPAGTVTGAPKVRAMEIIEELEREKRGIYAGAVGYFDFSGNMDFCIAIRTLIFEGERVVAQAGAGIVFDSIPEREIAEMENKARALTESLRWREK